MKDLTTTVDFPAAKSLFSDLINSSWFKNNGFAPAIPGANIIDNEKEYKIDIAAPGLKDENFDVSFNENTLTVKAKKEEEKKEEKDNYVKTEYNYDSFSRSFYLDEPVDENKIEASYKSGILELHIPKKEVKAKNHGKQIKVNGKNHSADARK